MPKKLPREIFFSNKKKISIFEAEGEILAESLTVTPPGIPIILMGEKCLPSHIEKIMNLPEGLSINGYFNPKDVKINVIRKEINENLKVKKSDYLVIHEHEGLFFVYNSLLGFPSILNKRSIDIISDFRDGKKIKESRYRGEKNYKELIEDFIDRYYLVSQDERIILKNKSKKYLKESSGGKAINSLYLVLTDSCNFNCPYCLPNVANKTNLKKELLKKSVALKNVDDYIFLIKKRGLKKGSINFRGGEPLLNYNLLKYIVLYTQKNSEVEFEYSIITNASLVNREIASFLAKYKISVTVSIDGQEEVHNKTRFLGKQEKGSFPMVKRGINILSESKANFHSVYTTLTDYNFKELSVEIVDFLKENDIKSWVIEPDLTNEISFSSNEIVQKIMSIKKYAKNSGIEVSGYWEYPYKKIFSSILHDNKFGFCKTTCGELISLKPNGGFTTCNYMPVLLDGVDSLKDIHKSKKFDEILKERCFVNLQNCRGCKIEGQCRGGCTITYFESKKNNKKNILKSRCDLYVKFTEKLIEEKIKELV